MSDLKNAFCQDTVTIDQLMMHRFRHGMTINHYYPDGSIRKGRKERTNEQVIDRSQEERTNDQKIIDRCRDRLNIINNKMLINDFFIAHACINNLT